MFLNKNKHGKVDQAQGSAFSGLGPPELSENAYKESEKERLLYEEKFNDKDEPPEFRDKYLDVDLAIRMLKRRSRYQALICELVFYIALVGVYCYYLFTYVVVSDAYQISYVIAQNLIDQPFHHTAYYYDSQGERFRETNQSFAMCQLPFTGENIQTFTNETLEVPGYCFPNASSCVYCAPTEEELTFREVRSLGHAKSWLKFLLMESPLFKNTTRYGNETIGNIEDSDYILSGHTFLPAGAVRLHQVRAKHGPCDRLSSTNKRDNCVRFLSSWENVNSSETFVGSQGKVYNYTTAEEASESVLGVNYQANNVDGILFTYPSSGYMIDVPSGDRLASSLVYLEDIDENDWIDQDTALLQVSFTMYSVNLNTFVYQSFTVELTPYEVAASSYETRPFQLINTSDSGMPLEVAILVICSLFLLYFLYVVFFVRLRRMSLAKAFRGWIPYDILNVSLVIASVAVRTSLRYDQGPSADLDTVLEKLLPENRITYDGYIEVLSRNVILAKLLSSLSLIVCFLKFFKYVDLNKRFSIALTSVFVSRSRLLSWVLLMMTIIMAFSFLVYFAYGYYSPRYSTIWNSLQSILLYTVQVYAQGVLDPFTYSNQIVDNGQQFGVQPLSAYKVDLSQYDLGITDYQYSLAFTRALFWVLMFVVIVIILVTNLFQAILIYGYQIVFQDVVEDENLRKEQHESQRKSRQYSKETWFKRQIRSLNDISRMGRKHKIMYRLSTAPECKFRNLLSYTEVLKIMQDVDSDPKYARRATLQLMALYQTQLSRIPDAAVLFQDIQVALKEGRSPFDIKRDELPIISKDGKNFNPSKKEEWIRDLQSGDLIQSMLFVHCLQLEQENEKFEKRLQEVQSLQHEIREKAMLLESKLIELQKREMERRGDFVDDVDDPWAPRATSCVEPRIDGKFDAHHVASDGTHRYLGAYGDFHLADNAIREMDAKLKSLQTKPAAETNLGNLASYIGFGGRKSDKASDGNVGSEDEDDDDDRSSMYSSDDEQSRI